MKTDVAQKWVQLSGQVEEGAHHFPSSLWGNSSESNQESVYI